MKNGNYKVGIERRLTRLEIAIYITLALHGVDYLNGFAFKMLPALFSFLR